MSLVLDIDPHVQKTLEEAFGPALESRLLEALATEGYRTGALSRFQLQKILRLPDQWATEAWLKHHQIYPDQGIEEVLQDAERSRKAREAACSSSQTRHP